MGNSNWVSTYAKIGKDVDAYLEELGAKRFMPLEICDKSGM